ncbi:putative signal peptide peptidase SppA [Andreprevotia sp. IGB-42]|uniref:S49 family peptidase n=1 Tax=Andreprevotia sp. IGB-42 TaxID=2497473 RepID=UPI001358685F|nr:S49 family peptidase [Andreprevotia sp. IGB-42]KAF0811632.1 putative signal peptide peptidase SppA [Andreprevotia sp. IGB-42]
MQENWERQVLNDLLKDGLKEQRRKRRWGIFFKLLGFAYLIVVTTMLVGGFKSGELESVSTGPHTAIVNMDGVISANGEANVQVILDGLDRAFDDKNTRGVILAVNSPGGSPVEAGQLNDGMLRLKKKHPKVPLYVVVGDICASGCYYAAVAADKIYADKASIVGSIGVLMDGFGFTGAMEKLGVERRLLTAGKNKGFLDPFSPVSDEQKAKAQDMLTEIHQQFIDVVKAGRGKRLGNDPDLFTGLVWSGAKSVQMGLIDGLGSVDSVARDVIKADDIVDFTPQPGYLDRFARRVGVTAAAHLGSQLRMSLQ